MFRPAQRLQRRSRGGGRFTGRAQRGRRGSAMPKPTARSQAIRLMRSLRLLQPDEGHLGARLPACGFFRKVLRLS